MSTLQAVLPAGVDDPRHPSGGNVYDRRVLDGLRALGWTVHEHPVAGPWPRADPSARAALGAVMAGLPDGALTLVDGLLAPDVADVLVPAGERLRLVVLAHMAFGETDPVWARGETAVMTAASRVVTTSRWTREWLSRNTHVAAERVDVVQPGVDQAPVAPGSDAGGELLCVGAVTRGKGHDVLLAALAAVADLPWRCTCAGALDVEPAFATQVRRTAEESGLAERVTFPGALAGGDLDRAYAGADLLVLASRGESYGLVVTEALARAVPVLATEVGGLPTALGRTAGGTVPGILVPVDDAASLAEALRRWLTEPAVRTTLRHAARERRDSLRAWSESAGELSRVLEDVLYEPPGRSARMSR